MDLHEYEVSARMRPVEIVNAASAYDARKAYAERHGVHVVDVIARLRDWPASWGKYLQ